MSRIFSLLFLLTPLFAEEFVLRNDQVLFNYGVTKITETIGELKAKTGASLYISAVGELDENVTIAEYSQKLLDDRNITSSYVLLTISASDRRLYMIVSPDLEDKIDKEKTLCETSDCPIAPFFTKTRADQSEKLLINVGVFNGVAYIIDAIAQGYGVTLKSSQGSVSKDYASFFQKSDDTLLNPKGVEKMTEMIGELKAKTGVGVYLGVVKKLRENQTITDYAKELANNLSAPFIALALSSGDAQIQMIVSPDLAGKIDKEDVLCISPGCPIIPLIAEHRKDVGIETQINAGIFNGVAYIADAIAKEYGATLESSVGSGSKDFTTVLTTIVKIMVVATLIGLVVAYRRGKKEGQ
ncbi:MAG: TPM domain-containing protein [Helicobacteraceae bacterium]|jgi:hypothetical protein|nr:TPM domain-containing protein [Helicobacteraceae bacterium]